MYNFTIDTTIINEYSTNNYTSYNIGIIRDSLSNDYFENLFVEIDSSNITTARILRYNINPISRLISSVITTPIIFNSTNINGKEEPGGIECQTVSVYLQTQCGCPGHHWPGETGCDCPNDPSTTVLLNSYTSCSSGGGGDVFDTGSLPNDPGTSILFTTTGGGSGGGSTAVPVIINYEKLRKKNFFIGTFLTNTEKSWFNNQSEEIQGAIMSYMESTLIDENGFELINVSEYSTETKDFVKELINHCLTYNLTNQQSKNYINSNIIVSKIIDTNLDACGKSVLTKLKNLNQNDISLILRRFGNVNSTFNLTFTTDYPADPNDLASTNWVLDSNSNTIPYNYIIKIRTEETQISTELAIAGSLLHEIIHAYFLSLIDDCVQASNCTTLQTFPELWNFYVANQTGSPTNGISQHNQIAMSYVNIMGAALQEYVTGVSVQPGMQTQVYTDVAWYGLQGTTPYNALPQIDKDRINFRFENVELLNQQSTNPSGIVVSPVGTRNTPC
ncbi:hypothetical protein ACFO3U_08105 [Flavobacterium ponti]|uniref:Uncharacterized protein n=2 Tax=Flavobacterium ponti TaxID=665133 RepID=A0ABV9P5G2_9FLAO